MATEYPARSEQIVDGIYPLGALIRRSAGSAVYETEFVEGEKAVPAVIKIREVESAEVEIRSHLLRNADALEHPNLLRLYASGSSVLEGVPVFYIVMERADESLEAVLTERPLTPGETRDMLGPALGALGYLHKNGYAHSRLRPSNVLAVNDQLKLSSDSVTLANDGEAAEDMRALGDLIVYALTQKMGSREFTEIPQPLADIARHCLDPHAARRWTVDQVSASLHAPVPVVETVTEEAPKAAGAHKGLPKWIHACLAALVVTVLVVAVIRSNDTPPAATAATAPIAAITHQEPQPPAPNPSATPESRKVSGWSVIVAAYSARKAAEKRMSEMAKKWPNFGITVLESRAEKTPYLVVLGRNLSEDQAKTLRQHAIDSGLPRDTYIKRLSESRFIPY